MMKHHEPGTNADQEQPGEAHEPPAPPPGPLDHQGMPGDGSGPPGAIATLGDLIQQTGGVIRIAVRHRILRPATP